ncbi:PEP-CTERM sorting domain-containing protein [Accumulibacter sp.]|uniref:PEP-CTERM sorting domain-containing protein n=1 Tax=Accumulibacter sp. TaxID=2053492 RepID=UPI00263602EE|nr:PEP-CTERM sorting domain-containing protein [Accumulibacter sp.]
MKIFQKVSKAVLLMLALAGVSSAQAVNVITGSLWHVPEAVTFNAIPANVPGTTPDVKFDVNSPMNFSGNSVTVGTWLASSSAFNLVENTPGTLASLMDDGIVGTMLRFTGFVTVTNGQSFTVTHDDGLTLIIGGVDLGFNAGPTAPTTSTETYTGPSGTFAFDLVYAECCGGPAVLQIDLPFSNVPNPTPEPASLALVGLALTGIAWRRRQRAN